MELRNGKVVAAPASAEKQFKKCQRHPQGDAMCVACAMSGHTPSSWDAYVEEQRAKVQRGERCHAMPSFGSHRRMVPPPADSV